MFILVVRLFVKYFNSVGIWSKYVLYFLVYARIGAIVCNTDGGDYFIPCLILNIFP